MAKNKASNNEQPREVKIDAARANEIIEEIESEIHRAAEQAFQPKEITRIIVTGKLNI